MQRSIRLHDIEEVEQSLFAARDARHNVTSDAFVKVAFAGSGELDESEEAEMMGVLYCWMKAEDPIRRSACQHAVVERLTARRHVYHTRRQRGSGAPPFVALATHVLMLPCIEDVDASSKSISDTALPVVAVVWETKHRLDGIQCMTHTMYLCPYSAWAYLSRGRRLCRTITLALPKRIGKAMKQVAEDACTHREHQCSMCDFLHHELRDIAETATAYDAHDWLTREWELDQEDKDDHDAAVQQQQQQYTLERVADVFDMCLQLSHTWKKCSLTTFYFHLSVVYDVVSSRRKALGDVNIEALYVMQMRLQSLKKVLSARNCELRQLYATVYEEDKLVERDEELRVMERQCAIHIGKAELDDAAPDGSQSVEIDDVSTLFQYVPEFASMTDFVTFVLNKVREVALHTDHCAVLPKFADFILTSALLVECKPEVLRSEIGCWQYVWRFSFPETVVATHMIAGMLSACGYCYTFRNGAISHGGIDAVPSYRRGVAALEHVADTYVNRSCREQLCQIAHYPALFTETSACTPGKPKLSTAFEHVLHYCIPGIAKFCVTSGRVVISSTNAQQTLAALVQVLLPIVVIDDDDVLVEGADL
jgi:hypothetical protein